MESISAKIGSKVELECGSTLSPPISYSWKRVQNKGAVPMGSKLRGSTLILPRLKGSQDAGIYVCKANNSQIEQIYKVLTVTDLIPHFKNDSFMELTELEDAYLTFSIVISLRAEGKNGLILYKSQDTKNGDYISLHLEEGLPIFRFDLGSGTAILKAKKPIKMNEWITIKMERNRRNATMTIGKNQIVYGRIGGKFQGLDLNSHLYLGGHPKFLELGFENSFNGCVSQLVINSKNVQISPGQTKNYNVDTCSVCNQK